MKDSQENKQETKSLASAYHSEDSSGEGRSLAPPPFGFTNPVVQQSPIIQMREATWIERRAWLSFFDHYIPRMFLNNYMDDTGDTITLTQQQMEDCNPIVSITRSEQIQADIARMRASGGGGITHYADQRGWGGAQTNGSLGNFTIYYSGTLQVDPDGEWAFNGTLRFYDYWDFDPKEFGESGRSIPGELKTRVAAYGLPGSPFRIESETVDVSQTSRMTRASWGSGAEPVHVPDNAGRSGSDIAVGADVGVSAGPVGDVGGADVGANASEDLN
jgi:hypothetical protein